MSASLVGSLRRSERGEHDELDRLIERRARKKSPRDAANALEESWKASEEAHRAEHQEANRHAWCSYYRRLAANHAGIAEHFEGKAAALAEETL